jgi:hypothetical protein
MTTNAYLLSWDMYGLEACIPITQYENWDKDQLISILKENKSKPNPLNSIVNMMLFRARANGHRHYEIYAVDCDKSYTEETLRNMFKTDPQGSAELIRKRGVKLFSDRPRANTIKIT